jgi:hypothetical protein
LTLLGTRRLDGRSALAVAVRRWKADVTADLGGNLSRAQETILAAAAQSWVILSSLDDYIARQPSLVTKKRQVLPVVLQRMQIADSLARHLERLGLERRAKEVPSLQAYLAARAETPPRAAEVGAPPSAPSAASDVPAGGTDISGTVEGGRALPPDETAHAHPGRSQPT